MKDLREDHDYKQEDVSKYLNCSKDRYAKWENGVNSIPLEYTVKLSELYDVSISYILGQSNKKRKNVVSKLDKGVLAQNIKRYRIENSELQKTLAFVLNCSVDSISNYEKAKNNVPVEKLLMICDHYDIDADDLLEQK